MYQYRLMKVCFIHWVITQYYFLCDPNCLTFGHWNSLCSFDRSLLMWYVCFSMLLLSGTKRCSKIMLCISCPSLRISHSQRIPGLFLWEIKIWVLHIFICTKVSSLLDYFGWQCKEIYLFVFAYTYIYNYAISICNHMYICNS